MAQIKQLTGEELKQMERLIFIEENVRIYDSPGHLDRYTAIFMHKPDFRTKRFVCLGMSENPFDPSGYGQHSMAVYDREGGNAHLGRRVGYDKLPEPCQRLLSSSLFGRA